MERKPIPSSIPDGWECCSLNDFTEIILGQSPPSSTYNKKEEGLPFFQGKADFHSLYPTPRTWCSAPSKIAEKDDILISVRAPVGPTNLAPCRSCIGRGLAALRPLGGIDPKFVLYLLRTYEGELAGKGTGSTFNAISGNILRHFIVPLPPLAEQHRIVAKLDALFERLRNAQTQLTDAIISAEDLEKKVLYGASTGSLTREWREFHPSICITNYGLGPQEESNRKIGNSHLWGSGNVPELTDDERKSIPDCWIWTKVGQLGCKPGEAVQIGPMSMQSSTFSSEGVPVLNVGCIQWDFIDETKLNFLPNDLTDKFRRYRIEEGDLLFTRSGTIGRCAIATEKQAGYLMTFHLLRVRLDRQRCLPEFLKIIFRGAPHIRRQMEKAAIGTTRAGFNTRLLEGLDVPLPALPEQQAIVKRLQSLFDYCEIIQKRCRCSQTMIEQARTSILEMAFDGKLVPQCPTDVPASVLLERIRAERSKGKGKQTCIVT